MILSSVGGNFQWADGNHLLHFLLINRNSSDFKRAKSSANVEKKIYINSDNIPVFSVSSFDSSQRRVNAFTIFLFLLVFSLNND